MEKEKERLLELLKEKAFQKKKVILASGRESDFYIDCRQVTLHPEGSLLVGRIFLRLIRDFTEKIDAVGGVPVAAIPVVSSISLVSQIEGCPIPAFIIRKEPKPHGTGLWIEGMGNLKKGAKVAIVEDVITTGNSLLNAINTAEKEDMKVVLVLALVDRNEGGREAIEDRGYRLEALFSRSDFP